MRTPDCHKDRKHYVRSLCWSCWSASARGTTPRVKNRKATCHPESRHVAKGLCAECDATRRRANQNRKATCHPDRKLFSRELCSRCYRVQRFANRREELASYERRYKAIVRNSPTYGLTKAQGVVCRETLADLGRVYKPNFLSVCNKADRTTVAA